MDPTIVSRPSPLGKEHKKERLVFVAWSLYFGCSSYITALKHDAHVYNTVSQLHAAMTSTRYMRRRRRLFLCSAVAVVEQKLQISPCFKKEKQIVFLAFVKKIVSYTYP